MTHEITNICIRHSFRKDLREKSLDLITHKSKMIEKQTLPYTMNDGHLLPKTTYLFRPQQNLEIYPESDDKIALVHVWY